LGPNGAGKTTTLKLILGLIKPDEGDVSVFGQKVNAANRLAVLRQTGSLIENPSGYGHLTGLENLQIVQKLKGASEEEIVRVLKTVRLYEQRDKKLKNYSLGMRQRLGLAMALLGEPKLLILDEPTNGLDPAGIQEIRELIRSLPKERDMTVIVSSHLLNEVEQMADHVGIIHHGEMLYQGPLSELEKQGGNLEDVFLLMTGGGESL
jgi:ABC-2 type transport system ATP-binding protein